MSRGISSYVCGKISLKYCLIHLRKFKNRKSNILAQSLNISIQKPLCFEFEEGRCSQLYPGSFSLKILRDFCYETLPTVFTNVKLIFPGDSTLIWEYL